MKRLQLILLTLTVAFVCLSTDNVQAQLANQGGSCSNPVVLPANSVNVPDSLPADSLKWYSMVANSNRLNIRVIVLASSVGHIHTINLYSACNAMPIAQVSVSNNIQDTIILSDSLLVTGNKYYIELLDDIPMCTRCIAGSALYLLQVSNSAIIGGNFQQLYSGSNICGLNYAYASVPLHARVNCNPPEVKGITQPAPMVISNMPPSASIVKAFVIYSIIDIAYYPGGPYSPTFNFYVPNNINPFTVTASLLSSLPGATAWDQNQCPDGCGQRIYNSDFTGSYDNTSSFYADVTNLVKSCPAAPNYNGTYYIDGKSISQGLTPFNCHNPDPINWDPDGATLIIIYQENCAFYVGTFSLYAGLDEGNGFRQYSIPIAPVPNNIGNLTGENGIIMVGDFEPQKPGDQMQYGDFYGINTGLAPTYANDLNSVCLWNTYQQTVPAMPTYTVGQASVPFSVKTTPDDVNIVAMGAYYSIRSEGCFNPPIINLSGPACVGGTPASLTANVTGGTSPYTYLWSNNQTTSTLTGVSAGTYSITVTSATGCTATAAITLESCCNSPNVFFDLQKASGMFFNPYGPIPTSANFSGTFIVDKNFEFLDCPDIQMQAGAKIRVLPGITLTIDNSRLWACGDMWQGIILEPGAKLIIRNSSIVEDAIQAIYASPGSPASTITVNTLSKLNDNYQDIVIDGQPSGNNLFMDNSILTCGPDPGFSPGYLKVPHLNGITYSGVYFNNVTGAVPITVGTPGTFNDANQFSNMNYGVYSNSSDFNVYNNHFQHLVGYVNICCPPPIGVAVYGVSNFNINLPSTYYHAYVGGYGLAPPLLQFGNSMIDCYRGVDLTNYVDMAVIDNAMTTVSNGYLIGDHGVFIKMGYCTRMDINNNDISNFTVGIHLLRTYMGKQLGSDNNINSNRIYISGSSTPRTMYYGVLAEDVNSFLGLQGPFVLNVNNNTIQNGFYDVCLRNMHEEFVNVANNPLLYILPSAQNYNSYVVKAGVEIENCSKVMQVINNPNIYATGTYIGSHPIAKADSDVVGIRSYLSPSNYIACNNIYDVGQCMRFEGACLNQSVFSNTMANAAGTKCYDGLVLWRGGVIGQQGNTTIPIGDIWGPPANFVHSQTYTYNSPPPGLPAYHSAMWLLPFPPLPILNFSFNNPQSLNSYNAPGALNVATGTNPSCPAELFPLFPATVQQQLNQIVHDSVAFQINIPASQYISKQYALEAINMDTALMAGDTALQNFNANVMPTSMGSIYKVKKYIALNNLPMANATNSSITPNNTIEHFQKIVNRIYLNTIAINVSPPTPGDIIQLEHIANGCPLVDGTAVFEARSLLNYFLDSAIVYSDSACIGVKDKKHESIKSDNDGGNSVASNVKVYPNPANTQLNVEVNLEQGVVAHICLYNSLGQLVQCVELQSNLTTLPISTLATGIYLYRVLDAKGNVLKADKQMIIH